MWLLPLPLEQYSSVIGSILKFFVGSITPRSEMGERKTTVVCLIPPRGMTYTAGMSRFPTTFDATLNMTTTYMHACSFGTAS